MMYLISVEESIKRILTTPIGSRVMRPLYGSRLYLLRDRTYSKPWELLATRFIFEAIAQNEPRAVVDRVTFEVAPVVGVVNMKVHLSDGNTVGVTYD